MSNKKKILLLTDWYEPGFKAGGPIQSCRNFIRALQDVYDMSIVTGDRDHGDTRPYQGIATDTWIGLDKGTRIWYAGAGTLKAGVLKKLIDETAPDYLYLNSMYSYSFTLLPLWLKWRGGIDASVVIAPRGMLQAGAMSFKSRKKQLLISLLRVSGLPGKLIFQATDEQEEKDIVKYFPSAGKVLVAPNFPKMDVITWKQVPKIPGELRCVFISRLAPKKNLLFLLQVLSALEPSIRLQLNLYGEIEDQAYWKKCLLAIGNLPPHISVSCKGAIPNESVPEILQQHHIFVLPTLGENFGHAIFEAFLSGKPVVISNKTPWLKLAEKQIGFDLPIEVPAFVHAIVNFAAMDQIAYDKWSLSAFEYAAEVQKARLLKEKYGELFP